MKNKTALWPRTLAKSLIFGGGTFATGALIQEIMRQQALQEEKKRKYVPENALIVDLPPQKHAGEITDPAFLKSAQSSLKLAWGLPSLETGAAILTGVPVGFLGTKMVYDRWKEKQLNKEIAEANKRYAETLREIGKTSGDLTPNVDMFCAAIGETLGKEAGSGSLGKAFNWLVKKTPGLRSLTPHEAAALGVVAIPATIGTAALGRDMLKEIRPTNPVSGTVAWLKRFWKYMALGATGVVGAGMINADRRRAAGSARAKLPTAVVLNYGKPAQEPVPPLQQENQEEPVI